MFEIVNRIGKEGIGGIGAHDAYGVHGVKSESPCENVWCVAHFPHDGQYFIFRGFRNGRAAVYDSWDGSYRKARSLWYIIDVHTLPFILKALTFLGHYTIIGRGWQDQFEKTARNDACFQLYQRLNYHVCFKSMNNSFKRRSDYKSGEKYVPQDWSGWNINHDWKRKD